VLLFRLGTKSAYIITILAGNKNKFKKKKNRNETIALICRRGRDDSDLTCQKNSNETSIRLGETGDAVVVDHIGRARQWRSVVT
jgi:hypothetical protein